MVDPQDLLALARQLASPGPPAPNDVALRRAVSSAYYAVFHALLGAAAHRFMGPGQESTPGFSLIYRAFDHNHIRRTCEDLQATTLRGKLQDVLGTTRVSQAMRDFARAFPPLQNARHRADYDPSVRFVPSDVAVIITEAEAAIDDFHAAPPAEQADILALLLVGTRT